MRDTDATIEALKRGEPWAFDRFYRDYAQQVLGWAIRLGGPYVDAEELAQEVFLVAVRRVGTFRGEAAVTTWLFAITRNLVANARRRAALRRLVGMASLPEIPSDDEGADESLQRLRRRRAVQLALETLGQREREVLVLMDLEERSAPEVSNLLGIPAGTVYSRLHYARKAFAKALQREGLGEAREAAAEAAGTAESERSTGTWGGAR